MEWDMNKRHREAMLKRFVELSSQVEGIRTTVAKQVADVVEMLDDLSKQVQTLTERHEKMRAWLLEHRGDFENGAGHDSEGTG